MVAPLCFAGVALGAYVVVVISIGRARRTGRTGYHRRGGAAQRRPQPRADPAVRDRGGGLRRLGVLAMFPAWPGRHSESSPSRTSGDAWAGRRRRGRLPRGQALDVGLLAALALGLAYPLVSGSSGFLSPGRAGEDRPSPPRREVECSPLGCPREGELLSLRADRRARRCSALLAAERWPLSPVLRCSPAPRSRLVLSTSPVTAASLAGAAALGVAAPDSDGDRRCDLHPLSGAVTAAVSPPRRSGRRSPSAARTASTSPSPSQARSAGCFRSTACWARLRSPWPGGRFGAARSSRPGRSRIPPPRSSRSQLLADLDEASSTPGRTRSPTSSCPSPRCSPLPAARRSRPGCRAPGHMAISLAALFAVVGLWPGGDARAPVLLAQRRGQQRVQLLLQSHVSVPRSEPLRPPCRDRNRGAARRALLRRRINVPPFPPR